MRLKTLFSLVVGLYCSTSTLAESWADMHMREEHNINSYDASSFFILHDSDNSKFWTRADILSLYGIMNPVDPTGHRKEPITPAQQDQVYRRICELMDFDHDGSVSLDEWLQFNKNGLQLPDFGYGPGHHGDVEYEYEIHHWLKYHSEDDSEENLNHPEDIEHEELFHHMEHKAESDQQKNIPTKFRVQR
ncbi:uncharacterized protein V2V93DRAFT_361855 [Kockiozyma suomiensis]|uniref:uncharacterized protein n=1 Tax=Kockiozyma suomiensis TaxID=1337062 RepID=UPI003343F2D7